ncbi:hypothetical protein [Pantoea sp. FN0305]|uniref:hypothetical protein n=1 Tax=Pantoea sp. FN0305 TaxID=3418559 RepID=UPI003CF54A99
MHFSYSIEANKNLTNKIVFFILTLVYLFSLTFDGILVRQFLTVSFFLFCVFYFFKNRVTFHPVVIFTAFFLVAVFFLFACLSPNENWKLKVFVVFSGLTFILVSYCLALLDYNKYFYHVFLITLVIIIFRYLMTGDENKIFFEASRNIVAAYVIFPAVSAILLSKNKKRNLTLSFVCLIICFFLKGRTGIILGTLLFFVTIYSYIGWRLVLLLSFLIFPIIIVSGISDFDEVLIKHTNFSEGLKTTRSVIYHEYFTGFSESNIFFGRAFNEMPIIKMLNNNPHNSFILLHSLFGVVPTILMILFFLIVFYLFFKRKKFITALMFMIFPIKALTDSVVFFNLLDVFYFSPLFFLLFYMEHSRKQDHLSRRMGN